jgi:hypothetical protein
MVTNERLPAPLIALVNQLREELDEKVLEAKRRQLALAEATLELLLKKETEAAPTSEEGESGEDVMSEDQPLAHTQASEGSFGLPLSSGGDASLFPPSGGSWQARLR